MRCRGSARLTALLAAVVAATSAVAADLDDALVLVPAVARTDGANGTHWRSDVVLHNPANDPRSLQLSYLVRGRPNPAPAVVPLEVPPGGSLLVEDVLATLFGVDAGAGALLAAADGPLIVASRTFTDAPGGGGYGQYVPGVPVAALDGVRQDLLPHLTDNDGFRTNLGFVNLGYDELLAWTVPIAFGVPAPKARMLQAPANGTSQYGGLLGETGGAIDDGMFWIETDFLSGPFVAWASVVDNLSGDAVLVLPATPIGEPVYVLGAAHLDGFGDTAWRTDLEVVGDPYLTVAYRLEWLPAGADNTAPEGVEFELAPGEARRHRDVVASVFSETGAGSVRVTPVLGEMLVSARTFTEADVGSFGQHIPATRVSSAATAATGDAAVCVHLREAGDLATGVRSHLLLQSTVPETVAVSAELFAADGTPLGVLDFELPPYGFLQDNRILRRLRPEGVGLAVARLTTATPGGAFLAGVSTVDGPTGDPIFVPATVIPAASLQGQLVPLQAAVVPDSKPSPNSTDPTATSARSRPQP